MIVPPSFVDAGLLRQEADPLTSSQARRRPEPEAIAVTRIVCTTDKIEELRPITPRAARLSLVYASLVGIGIAVE
jgi:hypothetical protein